MRVFQAVYPESIAHHDTTVVLQRTRTPRQCLVPAALCDGATRGCWLVSVVRAVDIERLESRQLGTCPYDGL